MSKIATVFVLITVFGLIVGNDVVQDFLKTIWLVVWGLFFLFLIVYHWLDHKGVFSYKKRDKES